MKVLVLILLGVLTACSPLDLIKGAIGGGPSLEVDTTIGDKEESVVGNIGDSSEIEAESITGGINTTYVEDIPPWAIIIMLLGWMFPSPTEMYREIKSWFSRSKKT